jgi:sterol desaturase/sphingolipid hydroxylase (fatty acid hydroxylase superfamily)
MPLESMVLAELISTPLGMFHHKESLKVPRWIADTIGKVLTMPGFHAVHHSRHLPHTNSNFGITLCLWDYIFGTAGLTRPVEGMSRGLNDHHDLGFFALFFGPFLPGFLQQSAAVRAVADVPVLSGTK